MVCILHRNMMSGQITEGVMYIYIDLADDQPFAREGAALRKQERRDGLAVGAFVVTGLVVSLVMAVLCPEALEMTQELFLLL